MHHIRERNANNSVVLVNLTRANSDDNINVLIIALKQVKVL